MIKKLSLILLLLACLFLLSYSADLRADLRERGLRQAARFSWERAARETIETYRRVSIQ